MENFKKEIQEVIDRVKNYINEFDGEAFKKNFVDKVNELMNFINSKIKK